MCTVKRTVLIFLCKEYYLIVMTVFTVQVWFSHFQAQINQHASLHSNSSLTHLVIIVSLFFDLQVKIPDNRSNNKLVTHET